MHLVTAAKVTVDEAKDLGNAIGIRCRRLVRRAEVPDMAKMLAQRLVNRWVAQERRRISKEKNSGGDGGSNAGA